MAKWGEGDPRWIVEERPDATNVNNWHWVEKNATPWSQDRLKNLLVGQTLEKGPVKVVFKELKKLEGEATANNRKAKLIFFFEWTIDIGFTAIVAGSELEYNGNVEVLNLSDENEAHEIEISSHISSPGPHDREIMHLLATEGLSLVRLKADAYVRELKEEFSKGIILPTDKAGNIRPQAVSTHGKTVVVDKKRFQNNVIVEARRTEDKQVVQHQTGGFELTETYKVPPDRLFDILTEPEMVRAWSPNSSIDARVDGEFSLLGGVMSGRFTSLKRDEQISMQWRLKSYPHGHFANVKLMFKDKGDSTDLVLTADNVPEPMIEETKTGFSRYYFQSIGKTFGISLNLF